MDRLIYVFCFIFIFSGLGFCDDNIKHSDITGTYKIVFFGSQVINKEQINDLAIERIIDKYYISNNCEKAQELYPAIVNQKLRNKCNSITQSKIVEGMVSILYDENNNLLVKSRLQLEGGVVDLSISDMYQYTVYLPIKDIKLLKGKGLINWNYDSVKHSPSSKSTSFIESPFYITKLGKNNLRIDTTLIGKNVKVMGKMITIDTLNTIILEKTDTNYTNLENKIQKQFAKIK